MIAVLFAAVIGLCVVLWSQPAAAPVVQIIQIQSGESVARKSDRLPVVKHHKRKPLLIVPAYYYRKSN